MSKVKFKGKLWRHIEKTLSFYCDRDIPRWMKSNRALKKEVKRRFIAAMKVEMQKQIEQDEERFLWGDPSCKEEPLGFINSGALKDE